MIVAIARQLADTIIEEGVVRILPEDDRFVAN
jgi:hypothetical protein